MKPLRNPPVELFQINTKETISLRFADERGRPIQGLAEAIPALHALPPHQHPAQDRSALAAADLSDGAAFFRASHRSHLRLPQPQGRAQPEAAPTRRGWPAIFVSRRVPNATLRDFLRSSFAHVGVGYYPNSLFVHLDVRKGPSAFWIDYSGPGQGSEYSPNARDDLRTGKVDWYRPAAGERVSSKAEHAESVDDLMENAVKGGR
jgi:hypothetical protein